MGQIPQSQTMSDEEIVVLTDLSLERWEQSLSWDTLKAQFSVLLILT